MKRDFGYVFLIAAGALLLWSFIRKQALQAGAMPAGNISGQQAPLDLTIAPAFPVEPFADGVQDTLNALGLGTTNTGATTPASVSTYSNNSSSNNAYSQPTTRTTDQ